MRIDKAAASRFIRAGLSKPNRAPNASDTMDGGPAADVEELATSDTQTHDFLEGAFAKADKLLQDLLADEDTQTTPNPHTDERNVDRNSSDIGKNSAKRKSGSVNDEEVPKSPAIPNSEDTSSTTSDLKRPKKRKKTFKRAHTTV